MRVLVLMDIDVGAVVSDIHHSYRHEEEPVRTELIRDEVDMVTNDVIDSFTYPDMNHAIKKEMSWRVDDVSVIDAVEVTPPKDRRRNPHFYISSSGGLQQLV